MRRTKRGSTDRKRRTRVARASHSTRDVLAALARLDEVEAMLPGLHGMTPEERLRTPGKLQRGEPEVLRALLSALEAHPHYFPPLGLDDESGRIDAAALRALLDERDALAALAERLEVLLARVSDSVIRVGASARAPLLKVYAVARVVAQHDRKLKTRIADAVDFYARNARQGAKTKAARRVG